MSVAEQPDRKDEPTPDAEHAVAEQAKQQPKGNPGKGDKLDEGVRPGDLTSESDGGSRG